MGSSFSTVFVDPCACSFLSPFASYQRPNPREPYPNCSSPASLGHLPENCAAIVLSHLDPPDICNLARLNRTFRSAAWADFVWESKLPCNCDVLSSRILTEGRGDEIRSTMCNRDIFARLCQTNTFDGGTKRAWLDKNSGKLSLSISAKGLTITGIDDRRYWNHIPTEESSFNSVAYLNQTWWLEVTGQVEFPFPAGRYGLFFRLQLGRSSKSFGRRICNTEHVHGWDIKPVRLQLWTSDGQHASSECFLKETGKWSFYHVGDFVVDGTKKFISLKLSMSQIDCTHTKGGLCLDSVCVFPCTYDSSGTKVFDSDFRRCP